MFERNGGLPFEPQLQRYREYMRQRQMTLGDLLLENRIVFLGSSPETGGDPRITDYLANVTIQKLLFLQYENKNQDIHFYINCPGGSVTATLAIYDTMQFLECPIATYCMGMAASGAAIILAAGTKGKRYALPHSKIMAHQPWGQVGGQVYDIEIQSNEICNAGQICNLSCDCVPGKLQPAPRCNHRLNHADAAPLALVCG